MAHGLTPSPYLFKLRGSKRIGDAVKPVAISIVLCAVFFAAILFSGCNAGAPPQVIKRAVVEQVVTTSIVSVTIKGTPAKAYSERGEVSDFQQEVLFIDIATGRVIKSMPLNGDGTVTVELPPGTYRMQAYDNENGDVRILVNITPKS